MLIAASPSGNSAPLPPGRPAELGRGGATPATPPPPPTPSPPAAATTPAPQDTGCLEALRTAGVVAEPASQPKPDDPSCSVETPVRLTAFTPSGSKASVALPEEPVVACRFAGPFTEWLGRIAVPVLGAARGVPLKAVRTGPGFECRSRNRQPGQKPSAHGLGLAIDIAAFEFRDGPALTIKPNGHSEPDVASLAGIRRAACGWFTTVLGPGSDPFHEDHLHLDLQLHGSSDRYRICQ